MSEVENQKDVELERIINAPEVGEDTPPESSPEITEGEPQPKPEENRVPESRLKEVIDELKATKQEIKELTQKGAVQPLSDEEKKELEARKFIAKAAREEYERIQNEKAEAETKREADIEEDIKFYHSIDKDFTEKIAEEIGEKYGTAKSPISIEQAYKIHKDLKEIKSQLPGAPKPKVPNPLRSGESVPAEIPKEDSSKSIWDIAESIKQSLKK